MPSVLPNTFYQKTPKQVHDDGIRTLSNGLRQIGISNPNTGQNSDYDKQWTAIGNEIAVGQANGVISVDANMPDTATGANLDRWLAVVGLSRNPAIGSRGVVTISLNQASTLIATGQQLTDVAGLRYQVSTGGTYANQTQVPVTSIDTGASTNHNNGDVLSWVTPPPYAAPTVTVGTPGSTDGLVDGSNSEVGVDGPPRNRLLNLLQNPPIGGNWAQVSSWGTLALPGVVSLCSVYPAILGPSSVFFCVSATVNLTGPFVANSFSRAIASSIVATVILPYVAGQLPEGVYVQGLSSADLPCDVAIQMALPSAPSAQPPGPGGGWIDGAPWPPSNGTDGARITAITSPTVVTINATTTTPPSPGGTHVAWVSSTTWTVVTATVVSYTGSSGAWVLTLDTPLPGVANNNYIFPASTNQATYLTSLLTSFASMGPGEWSSNATVLQRGFRHPIPGLVAPYAMGNIQLGNLIRSATEVQDAFYIYRQFTTPTVPASISIPPTIAPNVFIPNNIGFYQV
jgi:hypothetical protein